MSNKMALDALTAIQDAIGMATSGDSSDFVWPKSTMRHPGETAYGWICEKHGLGYQSGCICCAGDLMAYREQKDREARYAREDAIREASKKVRAAIAALQAEPQGWMPIETATEQDGLVMVYAPPQPGDWPDTVNITFDFICPDYEDWCHHSEAREHYLAVGGANACGPDVECTGPGEKAPYTHWMPLPTPPKD